MRDFIGDFVEKCRSDSETEEKQATNKSESIDVNDRSILAMGESQTQNFTNYHFENILGTHDIENLRKKASLAGSSLVPRERRHKRIVVNPNAIIDLFRTPRVGQNTVECYRINGIPDGYEIVDVSYAPEMGGFSFLISHPSFPVVPEGEWAPSFYGTFVERVKLAWEPQETSAALEVREDYLVEKWSNLL